jgi:3-oxoacyl-[acyl-carrier-protein] synthase II
VEVVPEPRRVVVTGLGAVTPVGLDVGSTWDSLVAGKGGAGPITQFDTKGFPVRIAAEATGFDGAAIFGKRRARHLDRFAQLGLVAAREAIEASGVLDGLDLERAGVVWGSGIGGLRTLEDQILMMHEREPDRVSPYLAPMMISNMAAGEIAIEHGLLGPNSCTVTACAASAHAIGDAAELIRWGRADVMVAGGSEGSITPIGMAAFAAAKALSERNDEPERASRPFDRGRDGFLAGEGGACLVLEDRERAVARGADIWAEIAGYGLTSDGFHQTAPHPTGDGAIRCMRMALDDARLDPSAVGYVNAHGTSTPLNDKTEASAIKVVLGDRVPVSSTKSMTGHLLGAAGALEAVATILTLRHGILPPTINHDEPDPEVGLDVVPNEAREHRVRVAISNSFGFGGHNAALVLTAV